MTVEVKPEEQILPEPILRGILRTGLVVPAIKGHGKSEAGKVITSEIIRNQPLKIQCKIFDVASNLRWSFLEGIKCQEITEDTRFFYNGNDHILFDIAMVEDDDKLSFMSKVVRTDYLKQRKKKEIGGGNFDEWILYLVEESQLLIGRYSLMKRIGRDVLGTLSIGRNFNMSFVLIGQRLADMSASAVEKCDGYLLGKILGDNDIAKLKRIVGRKSDIMEDVKKLELGKGHFIYFDGASAYDFNCPPYKNAGKPLEMWEPNLKTIPIWNYREGRKLW